MSEIREDDQGLHVEFNVSETMLTGAEDFRDLVPVGEVVGRSVRWWRVPLAPLSAEELAREMGGS